MSKSLTVDLGGTNIRAAIIENGSIVRQVATTCQADGSEQEIISQLFSLIDQLISPGIKMIGFGVPSVVDFSSGTVYDVQNIPSWKEVHLKDIIEKKYGIDTRVDNDVNCFVLGEKHFGAGRGFHDIVGITLGTGVGAGIIIDDKIYRGADTGAGELGNLPYLDSNYEQYCSSLWMKRHHVDAKALSERASRNDEKALSLWHEFGEHLGKLLQAILLTYNPQAVIIGGGIAKGAAYFEKEMRASLGRDFPYQREVDHTNIVFSQLENGNLLGASML